ncbi:hypothetical protein Ocin01_15620 [Orchesella cincta]|uniref:Uncharacterized protein n=1 Tax=Orchesella cincta TaxID=48709 RepID=A0A1D2MDU9_ORCCI|nr:hypothetical protein Ocin01_15620 [Orchesella cincta]
MAERHYSYYYTLKLSSLGIGTRTKILICMRIFVPATATAQTFGIIESFKIWNFESEELFQSLEVYSITGRSGESCQRRMNGRRPSLGTSQTFVRKYIETNSNHPQILQRHKDITWLKKIQTWTDNTIMILM